MVTLRITVRSTPQYPRVFSWKSFCDFSLFKSFCPRVPERPHVEVYVSPESGNPATHPISSDHICGSPPCSPSHCFADSPALTPLPKYSFFQDSFPPPLTFPADFLDSPFKAYIFPSITKLVAFRGIHSVVVFFPSYPCFPYLRYLLWDPPSFGVFSIWTPVLFYGAFSHFLAYHSRFLSIRMISGNSAEVFFSNFLRFFVMAHNALFCLFATTDTFVSSSYTSGFFL